MWNTDLISPYVKTWNTRNQETNSNPFGGYATGLYNCRLSLDFETGKRITAASAYYMPASSRINLKLLTGAHVTKILFKPELVNDKCVAVGVEFLVHGRVYSVSASKEIILSAGTIQTPQILELSGIGDSKLLRDQGIRTVVDLPGVGENLQNHVFAHVNFQAKSGIRTFGRIPDDLTFAAHVCLDELSKNPEFAAAEQERYDKTGQGWMAANDTVVVFTPLDKIVEERTLSNKIEGIESSIAEKSKGTLNELAMQQHSIQLDWLRQGRLPHLEFLLLSRGFVKPDPEGSYFMMSTGLQHPFSRGSVHIQSGDPLQQPLINPRYLNEEFDVFSFLSGYREIEKLAQTQPLAGIIEKQVMPAIHLTDDEVIEYIRGSCASGGHYMGTAAMARRELGGEPFNFMAFINSNVPCLITGVVDNNLKVHGTANLRIADASIIPIPIAAHIQATVYAIGEKAAALIKGTTF